MSRSLAIFGGTFDPVHFGHLRTALELKQQLEFDEMRMLPCHVPSHRDLPVASSGQRLRMLQLAVEDEPGLMVDDREIERGGVSYMVDTLQSFRDELGARISLSLVVGMDSFLSLPQWHEWQRIPDLAHIVVVARPGSQLPDSGIIERFVHARLSDSVAELKGSASGRVLFKELTPLDISASHIRQLVEQGQSPRFLLPDAVWAFIKQHGLYQ